MEAASGLTGCPLLEDAAGAAVFPLWGRGSCRAGGGILIACNEVVFLKNGLMLAVPENKSYLMGPEN